MGSGSHRLARGIFFLLTLFSLKWLIFPAKSWTPVQEEWCLPLLDMGLDICLLTLPIEAIFFLSPHFSKLHPGDMGSCPVPAASHPYSLSCVLLRGSSISPNFQVMCVPVGRHLLVANVQINTCSCLWVCRENQVWLLITAFGGENKWECGKWRPWCRRKMSSFVCSILTCEAWELARGSWGRRRPYPAPWWVTNAVSSQDPGCPSSGAASLTFVSFFIVAKLRRRKLSPGSVEGQWHHHGCRTQQAPFCPQSPKFPPLYQT